MSEDVLERIEKRELNIEVLTLICDGSYCQIDSDELTEELMNHAKRGKQMQWVSVKDRLPDESPFLAYVPSQTWSPIVMCAYDTKYRKNPFSDWVTEEELVPTHWMPLPPNPEEAE